MGEKQRPSLVREFGQFLWERKLWWMAPIVMTLLMLGMLVYFAEGHVVAPFIYTLF